MTSFPDRIIAVFFWIPAIAFLALMNTGPFLLDYFLKALPVLALSVFVFYFIPGIRGKLMTAGFLFSAAGDIFLALDRNQLFVFGLSAFLVAHLFYIAAFTRKKHLTTGRVIITGSILIYGTGLGIYLFPHLGDMQIPVMLYLVIIMAMGVSAAVGGANHPFVIAGAILFILSDSLIAVDRFLSPVPAAGLLIMITYYSGQFLIATGVRRTLSG